MNFAIARRCVFSLAMISATGCITITTPPFMLRAPEREWPATLAYARDLVKTGHAIRADSVLAAYAARFPQTPQAMETYYWRSLIRLQSAPGPQAEWVVPMLTAYVDAGGGTEHRVEAEALLRSAARVDSLSRRTDSLSTRIASFSGEVAGANARAADAKDAAAKVVTADTKDQDAEIRRLKDELAKSKEELERIKKRLAEPAKKPPR